MNSLTPDIMATNFEQHAAKGNIMLKELAEELRCPEDKARSARVLRAVLHALRNLIPIEESFQLLAQLPLIIKGVYVDGWSPKKRDRIRHIDEFVAEVYKEGGASAPTDFPDEDTTKVAIMAVFRVLRYHISPGEIEDIKSTMPQELKSLWEEPIWLF